MTFTDPKMKTRYTAFLDSLRSYIKTSKYKSFKNFQANLFLLHIESHLFAEPGIYMGMLNGVVLQGTKESNFTQEIIKG